FAKQLHVRLHAGTGKFAEIADFVGGDALGAQRAVSAVEAVAWPGVGLDHDVGTAFERRRAAVSARGAGAQRLARYHVVVEREPRRELGAGVVVLDHGAGVDDPVVARPPFGVAEESIECEVERVGRAEQTGASDAVEPRLGTPHYA